MYIERSNKHVAYSTGPSWLRLRYRHESQRAALPRSLRWIASLINCAPFAVDTFLRLASRHGLAFSAPLPPQFVNLQLLSARPIASDARNALFANETTFAADFSHLLAQNSAGSSVVKISCHSVLQRQTTFPIFDFGNYSKANNFQTSHRNLSVSFFFFFFIV